MHLLSKTYEYLRKDFPHSGGLSVALDYDCYWTERSRWGSELAEEMEQFKFQLIASVVGPASTVLDIGCGTGNLLTYLQRVRGATAHGIEISGKACESARRKGIDVVEADVSQYGGPFPEADYIVMSEVLEHLPNPEAVLHRVKGRFRKRLLVDVPNTGALNERLRLLMGRFPKQWVFHPGEHLRFWTVTDFLFMCRQLGLEVEKYYGLYDPYYQLGVKLWKVYPRLFARYVLYVIRPSAESS